jgi:hypothetical protein
MVRSKILDKGEETITIYPEVLETNRRGETYRVPAETGVTVRCTVAEERQSSAELAGQVDVKVVRILCRTVQGTGSQTRVVFRGEEWDLAEPPHFSSGVSRRMKHMELLLRSRNRLDETRV